MSVCIDRITTFWNYPDVLHLGLQDFCNHCKKCACYCPTGSISFGEKVIHNGYEKWPNDVEKCTRGRVGNKWWLDLEDIEGELTIPAHAGGRGKNRAT